MSYTQPNFKNCFRENITMKYKYNQSIYGLQEDELSAFLGLFTSKITGCGYRCLEKKDLLHQLPVPQNRLILILDGSASMEICGQTIFLEKGDMLFTKAYCILSASVGQIGCKFGYIYFHLDPLHLQESFFQKLGIQKDSMLWRSVQERLIFLFERILEESSSKKPGYLSLMENLFHAMAVEVYRSQVSLKKTDLHHSCCDSIQSEYLGKASSIIQENIQKNVSVETVAAEIGITENYLYKIFKSVLKCSPKEYILSARLDYASKMLLMTEYSIKDIALHMEFSSSIISQLHLKSIMVSLQKSSETMRRVLK